MFGVKLSQMFEILAVFFGQLIIRKKKNMQNYAQKGDIDHYSLHNIFITRKLWNRKWTFRLMLCNNIKYTIQYCFNVVFLFHSFLLITVGRD